MLAAWLHTLDPFIFRAGFLEPRWYGLAYVLSAVLGYLLYRRLAERGYTDLPAAKVADFITWVLLLGVLLKSKSLVARLNTIFRAFRCSSGRALVRNTGTCVAPILQATRCRW